jgi:hypothetical protein
MLPLQKQSLSAELQSLAMGDNPAHFSDRLLSQAQSDNFGLKDFKFWVAQCQVLESEQNYTEALAACERAITLKPNSKTARFGLVAAMPSYS